MMKIGILGGTFDPHKAHLQIAERAIKQFDLDKVLFIPSEIHGKKIFYIVYSQI